LGELLTGVGHRPASEAERRIAPSGTGSGPHLTCR